jgi:hypothetical protein
VNVLAFERCTETARSRAVRRAKFEPRSTLPVSAACAVANGVRETLARDLARPIVLQVLPPALPAVPAWRAILRDALLYRVRGTLCDAAFVLRPEDAAALAAATFGEPPPVPAQSLSPLESQVLLKLMRALTRTLGPVCGREISEPERVARIEGFTSYFELVVEAPAVRLGVAISRENGTNVGATLRLQDLADVEIDAAARVCLGLLPGSVVLQMRRNDLVPVDSRSLHAGRLLAGGALLARGEVGAVDGRGALKVTG